MKTQFILTKKKLNHFFPNLNWLATAEHGLGQPQLVAKHSLNLSFSLAKLVFILDFSPSNHPSGKVSKWPNTAKLRKAKLIRLMTRQHIIKMINFITNLNPPVPTSTSISAEVGPAQPQLGPAQPQLVYMSVCLCSSAMYPFFAPCY